MEAFSLGIYSCYNKNMRKKCRVCKSKLKHVLSLGQQYLSDFVPVEQQEKTPKFPLNLERCMNCGLVQLGETTPVPYLYNDHYGYRSGISNTIKADLKDNVEKAIDKVGLKEGDIVVDIGCNDCSLLLNYPLNIIRVGFDPITKFKLESASYRILFINDYFNYEAWGKGIGDSNKKARIITIISCFYDLDNPNKFLDDLAKVLADDGVIVIQQNYLVGMLMQNALDNCVHEHLEYYTLASLEKLLDRHGLEVFDAELNDINGGSFRTYIGHKNSHKIENSVGTLQESEKLLNLDKDDIYQEFAKRIKIIKEKILNFVQEEVKKGKTFILLGASTRGNTLLQYIGLNNNLIPYAMERNPEKWGKKIMSLDIPIISEQEARDKKPDYFFVLPWFFATEIADREFEYLQSGGKLIFPLPQPYIVDKNGRTDL